MIGPSFLHKVHQLVSTQPMDARVCVERTPSALLSHVRTKVRLNLGDGKPFAKLLRRPAVTAARLLIRAYQLTLSSVLGRHCRHLPTCSSYMDEAIDRHGLWAGGWMGTARLCRCHPFGTHGLDLVPETLPDGHRWYKPWTYGRWRSTYAPPMTETSIVCEAVETDGGEASTPVSRTVP
jgi:putative membrane protein insertion efficiency factor